MAWNPHTTVAALIERDGKFLMVEESIDGKPVINQPAGHLDNNETLIDAVIREVQEETGWSFQPIGISGIYQWQHPVKHHTYLRTTFYGEVSNHDQNQPLDEPIIRSDWFSRTQLLDSDLRSPMVLRCIDDYLDNKRYPLELLTHV